MIEGKRQLIGEILLRRGLINEEQLQQALSEQERTGERLGQILIRMGYIDSNELAEALGEQLGMEPVKLSQMDIPPYVITLVPPSFARQNRVVPIGEQNGRVQVAMEDPLDLLVIDNLRATLGREVEPVLASAEELSLALEKYYGAEEKTIDSMLQEISEQDISFVGMGEETEVGVEEGLDEDAPVVKLVSSIIEEAFHRRASDIHFEPLENRFRVRYRIDGVLHVVQELPKRLQGAVISRVKIMARMDIAERRLPQDGRIQMTVDGKQIDLRVSTLPGMYGESTVLRILEKGDVMRGLEDLGFVGEDLARFEHLIKTSTGILLVTGPTGSGKSTTLYAALSRLNKPDVKIITVEDPVEYQINGINQVHVRDDIGFTFARALRAILRQAPNIIMVGEIRDTETAEIAIQAALTGHLVFSTLHTNDAPGAVTRLIDMGIPPYKVASAIRAVMAQRLVRRICPKCKEPYEASPIEKAEIERALGIRLEKPLYKGRGCQYCNYTGYYDRIGIFELMEMTDEIRELVMQRSSSGVIRQVARRQGMKTLREDGMMKVVEGITTLSEVARVTQQYEDEVLLER